MNSIKRGATRVQECYVRTFSDLICHAFSSTNHKPWFTFLRHGVGNNINFTKHLVCIKDRNGQKNRYPTDKKNNHETCGNPITNNCFVCRKYLQRNVIIQYNTTQWWCKLCKLTLCAVDRPKTSNNKTKSVSCLVQHKSTYDHKNHIYCRAREFKRKKFPSLQQVQFIPKKMMVMAMKMNISVWNHMYNPRRTSGRTKLHNKRGNIRTTTQYTCIHCKRKQHKKTKKNHTLIRGRSKN